jgi:hypothetical protein
MAEFSGFWTSDDTSPEGDQVAGYTQAHWSTAGAIMAACSGFEGVAPSFLNGLAGTVTGANTVAINTGGGMVDGKFFLNDASQNVNIPSASGGGNTRIDRIVLRADWAGFNVSVTRIAGTDAGSPSAPAITQTSGTTYDILLYQALVDTGGTVTLTDERIFASPIVYRQGGHATQWQVVGTSNYPTPNAKIQVGVLAWAGGAASSGLTIGTFPIAFAAASGSPLCFANALGNANKIVNCTIDASDTQIYIYWNTVDASNITDCNFNWLAIGQV